MWLAATVTLITLVPVIFGLATSLAQSIVAQLATLIPAHPDRFTALTNDLRAWLGSIGVDPDQLHAALHEINFANIAALVADLLTGLVTQPTTISTTAMAERQRIRGRRRPISACSVAFSRRTRSSSGALVDRQVVLDVEGRVPAAVRLGHLGPPDRRG
jgi:uncharacterized membrane protein